MNAEGAIHELHLLERRKSSREGGFGADSLAGADLHPVRKNIIENPVRCGVRALHAAQIGRSRLSRWGQSSVFRGHAAPPFQLARNHLKLRQIEPEPLSSTARSGRRPACPHPHRILGSLVTEGEIITQYCGDAPLGRLHRSAIGLQVPISRANTMGHGETRSLSLSTLGSRKANGPGSQPRPAPADGSGVQSVDVKGAPHGNRSNSLNRG